MKKSISILFALIIAFFTLPFGSNLAFADGDYDNIKDGEYDLDITSLEKGTDEASVANDFVHNAVLSIDGDNATLTIDVGADGGAYEDFDFNIEWVKVDGNDPIATNEKGEFIAYTFNLKSVASKIGAEMKYVVPGFPALEDGHEVEFDMELSGLDDLPKVEPGDSEGNGEGTDDNGDESNSDNDEDETTNGEVDEDNGGDNNGATNGEEASNVDDKDKDNDEEVTNPKTGDTSNIWLYALLLVAATIPLGFKLKKHFN